jgi:hypothetical protein
MVLVSYKPINTMVLAGLIVMGMHFLQAGRTCATLPGTEGRVVDLGRVPQLCG